MKKFGGTILNILLVLAALVVLVVLPVLIKQHVEKNARQSLEEIAKPLVTQIIRKHKDSDSDASCLKVKISQQVDNTHFKAVATLDNGHDLEIIIEVRDENVIVTVRPGLDDLKELAKPIVTQMIREDLHGWAKCLKVRITERVDDTHFKAVATLDNGHDLKIIIEDNPYTNEDTTFYVSIPEQKMPSLKY